MNESEDTEGKRLAILSVATEWESRHGGLSTFNRDLCKAISLLGHDVFCLVPNALPVEIEAAASMGVTIVTAADDPGLSDDMRLSTQYQLPGDRTPDVIIGHGRVTGPVAKVLAGHHSRCSRIHFIHVAPGAIEWFKDHPTQAASRAEDREQLEVALAKSASLVAAVGPLLAREFGILLNGVRQDLFEFRPGLGTLRPTLASPRGIQCLVLGRAEDELLKGLDVAARAFSLLDHTQAPRPILMIRGAPPGSGDGLRKRLLEVGGTPGVDIRVRTYSPQSERIADDLAQSSVLLMPSRSEGFGLVGLEGIAASVPVLLSDRSGLAELMLELAPELAPLHIVRVTGDLEIDGPVWARRLDRVLRNRTAASRNAVALRDRLAPLMSWKDSAARMLSALPPRVVPYDRSEPATGKVIQLPTIDRTTTRATGADPEKAADLRIGDIGTVRSWGWDDHRLHTELYALDYETMEGLTDDHAGLVEQWGPVFAEHPESWRVLYARPGVVEGYWHFVPLFDDQYRDARAGRLKDVTITADCVRTFELPGIYNIYFAGICLRSEFRRPRGIRLLLHSVLEVLQLLAQEQVFIGEICANAFTPGGMALSKTLGMQSCGRHADHGEIYAGYLVDLLDLQIAQPFASLRDLYRAAFRRQNSA